MSKCLGRTVMSNRLSIYSKRPGCVNEDTLQERQRHYGLNGLFDPCFCLGQLPSWELILPAVSYMTFQTNIGRRARLGRRPGCYSATETRHDSLQYRTNKLSQPDQPTLRKGTTEMSISLHMWSALCTIRRAQLESY